MTFEEKQKELIKQVKKEFPILYFISEALNWLFLIIFVTGIVFLFIKAWWIILICIGIIYGIIVIQNKIDQKYILQVMICFNCIIYGLYAC